MAHQEAKCPACGVPLVDRTAGGAAVRFCETCDGIWVDAPTFEELSRRRGQQAPLKEEPVRPKASKPANPPIANVRYWPCPVCGDFMNRVNFARSSGVILDVCKPHGVWFERDELLKVVQFVRSGGLKRSRRLRRDSDNRGVDWRLTTAQSTPWALSSARPWYLALGLAEIAMDVLGLLH
jgi:Zn-finger nucleic acid-binding protein